MSSPPNLPMSLPIIQIPASCAGIHRRELNGRSSEGPPIGPRRRDKRCSLATNPFIHVTIIFVLKFRHSLSRTDVSLRACPLEAPENLRWVGLEFNPSRRFVCRSKKKSKMITNVYYNTKHAFTKWVYYTHAQVPLSKWKGSTRTNVRPPERETNNQVGEIGPGVVVQNDTFVSC